MSTASQTPAPYNLARADAAPYRVESADAAVAGDIACRVWESGGLASPGQQGVSGARYDWFYRDNPAGLAQVSLLYNLHDALPIGFLGIGARLMRFGAVTVPAGVLVDFVVAPGHRSVFPALLLQRAGRAVALQTMDVLLGLPDTKAIALCKRLDSHLSGQMRHYTRVVRSLPYLERILPRWLARPASRLVDLLDSAAASLQLALTATRADWTSVFDISFDELWEATDKQGLVIGVRDSRFLTWRFGQQPAQSFRTLVVRRGRNEALRSYFVCQTRDDSLVIKDLLGRGSDRDLATGLLAVVQRARAMGLKSVQLQLMASDRLYRVCRRAGFSHRGSRPFFAVVSERLRAAVAGASWYVTQADEDI
jgi:hypothetical protein